MFAKHSHKEETIQQSITKETPITKYKPGGLPINSIISTILSYNLNYRKKNPVFYTTFFFQSLDIISKCWKKNLCISFYSTLYV